MKLLVALFFVSLIPGFAHGQLHALPATDKGVFPDPQKFSSQKKLKSDPDTISILEAQSIRSLTISDGSNVNVLGKVWLEHFEMRTVDGDRTTSDKSTSEKLSDKMKKMLKNIRPGSRLTFEYIRVKVNDGTIRSIPPLNYIIAEKK